MQIASAAAPTSSDFHPAGGSTSAAGESSLARCWSLASSASAADAASNAAFAVTNAFFAASDGIAGTARRIPSASRAISSAPLMISAAVTFSVGGSGAFWFWDPARGSVAVADWSRGASEARGWGTRCEGGMGLTTTEGEEEERRLLTPGGLYLISGAGVCSEGEGAGGLDEGSSGCSRFSGTASPEEAPAPAPASSSGGAHRATTRAAGRRAGSAGARRGSARGVARTSPPKGDPRGGNPPASARALWGRARGGETRRARRGRGWRSATTARNSRGVPPGRGLAPATSASRADAHAEGAAIATRATASGARTTERDAFSNRRRDDARAPRRDADPLGSSRRAPSQPCAERDDRAALSATRVRGRDATTRGDLPDAERLTGKPEVARTTTNEASKYRAGRPDAKLNWWFSGSRAKPRRVAQGSSWSD